MGTSPQEPHASYPQAPPASASSGATVTLPSQSPTPNKPIGLALAALIVGIAAFLFGLIPVFGAIVGIVAVVLGSLALRKHQSKGMALTGIILGGVAILASILTTAGIGAAVDNASNTTTAIVQPAEPATEEPAVSPEASEPADETAPVVEAAAPEPEAPATPADYVSALIQAESYSEMMDMSKAGIYDQLTSEYGGQFSPEAAQYAVDTIDADWNANALASAKSFQETMAMSPEAIRDQLTSEYGSQFTAEEADYAVIHLND
jgi:hypothetical protein